MIWIAEPMNPFPFERCYIISQFTPDAIVTRLEEEIKKPVYSVKMIFSKPTGAYFKGKITNDAFKVIPVISGRNSFIPQISGTITPYLNGSQIYVRFKMHIIIIIFFIAMFTFVGYETMLSINKDIGLNQSTDADFIPPVVMLCIIVFGIVEFKSQCRRAKDKLIEITDGEMK